MELYTESSGISEISTSDCDLNSSMEMPKSPEHVIVQPRKLLFNDSPEFTNNNNTQNMARPQQPSLSPPARTHRALRLFDSPATPKTIIQKSTNATTNFLKMLSLNDKEEPHFAHRDVLAKPIDSSLSNVVKLLSTPSIVSDKPKAVPLHKSSLDNLMVSANVNPFTPPDMLFRTKKRTRRDGNDNLHNTSLPLFGNMAIIKMPPIAATSTFVNSSFMQHRHSVPITKVDSDSLENLYDREMMEVFQAPKRLALQDSNISRYEKEFIEIALLGAGEFGKVYQCLNRLDGCVYAIKKSIRPVAGSSLEKTALNEVYAHAVLGKHDNVVRYYSAWAENNHMLIQNEYCNGGSLASLLQERFLSETELKTLLLHVAEGLKYIHSNNLVHMDLKAGNIFLSKTPLRQNLLDGDDGFEDVYEEGDNDCNVVYKIGDLGLVTSITEPHVEEGDCRYLPNEILQEDYSQLPKADIFSLGITLYQAGGGGPLPKNGPEWHELRSAKMPILSNLSKEFNELINLMTHPEPEKRPSSTSIFNHPILCPIDNKSKAQLSLELSMERQKNELLMKKLRESTRLIKSYEMSRTPVGKKAKPTPREREPIASDRKLRSYSRKRQRFAAMNDRRNLRDRNKSFHDEEFH